MKYQTGWKINMLENNKQALEKEIEELKARLNEYEKIKRKHEHRLFCKSSEYVCDNKFKSCSYDGVIDYIIDDVVKFKEYNDIWEKEYNKLKEIINKIDKRVPIEKVLDLLDAYENINDNLMKDNSILIKDNTKLIEKIKEYENCASQEVVLCSGNSIEDLMNFVNGVCIDSDKEIVITKNKHEVIEAYDLDEMLYLLMNSKKFRIELDDFGCNEMAGFLKTIYDCSLDDKVKIVFEPDMSDLKSEIEDNVEYLTNKRIEEVLNNYFTSMNSKFKKE